MSFRYIGNHPLVLLTVKLDLKCFSGGPFVLADLDIARFLPSNDGLWFSDKTVRVGSAQNGKSILCHY